MHVHIAWQIYHHQQKVKVSAWEAWLGWRAQSRAQRGRAGSHLGILCHGQCPGKGTHTALSRVSFLRVGIRVKS